MNETLASRMRCTRWIGECPESGHRKLLRATNGRNRHQRASPLQSAVRKPPMFRRDQYSSRTLSCIASSTSEEVDIASPSASSQSHQLNESTAMSVSSKLDENISCTIDFASERGIAITDTSLVFEQTTSSSSNPLLTSKHVGKVRDSYVLSDGRVIIITTDRQSAFDRVLASVPFKGQVLNETSAFWMRETEHIMKNALIDVIDHNVSVMENCSPLPIEFIVRQYATGSTNTSLWTHYKSGSRNYCGHTLPEGIVKNAKLPEAIVTPTTKSDDGDCLISGEEIIARGVLSSDQWQFLEKKCLELFQFGSEQSKARGLILVDTKYEIGTNKNGEFVLIDEVHTPDSSRFWIASSYLERQSRGVEPESIDKEFFRLWFKERCDPYAFNKSQAHLFPVAPSSLVSELAKRYVYLQEQITGQKVNLPHLLGNEAESYDPRERIAQNVGSYLNLHVTVDKNS